METTHKRSDTVCTVSGGESAEECISKDNSYPQVFRVTWMPDDHLNEWTRILQGVAADRVENCLVQYVEESIEPAGWRAVWRASAHPPDSVLQFLQPTDVLVDVENVSREKLLAEVTILRPVEDSLLESDRELVKQKKNTKVMVPLKELYPLAEQENDVLDIATTAEVVDQIRFFYKHIWQAWDLEEESCFYDHYRLTARLKLYHDIKSGIIPDAIGCELQSVVRKAAVVQDEITKIEIATRVEDVDSDVDQSDVVRLIHLHKQLEQLKSRYELLQDPVLRELSSHQQQLEQCTSINGKEECNQAMIKVVADSLTVQQVTQHMSNFTDLIKSLPNQVPENAVCQFYPNLQSALVFSRRGDVVVLLPGSHTLQHLGLISEGGTCVGLGENVIIEGSKDAGDILFDISGDFKLQNVTLRPTSGQVGIVHHKGCLTLRSVVIKGGRNGIVGLGKTHSKFEGVTVQSCSGSGMDFRDGAEARVSSSSLSDCQTGIKLEEGAKVWLSSCTVKDNRRYGALVVWPHDTDVSKFSGIPKDGFMECMLQEYEGNTIEHNKEDVAVVTAEAPPFLQSSSAETSNQDAFMKNLCHSSASLDSGYDVKESLEA